MVGIEVSHDRSPQDSPWVVAQAPALHARCLPGSLVALLGPVVSTRFYEFLLGSGIEDVYTARHDGRLLGVAVVSKEPRTIARRFLMAYPLAFGSRLAFGAVCQSSIRAALSDALSGKNPAPPAVDGMPELIQIFVDQEFASGGIGSRLLAALEAPLKAQRRPAYYIKTENSPKNRAIRFYERHGYNMVLDGNGSGSFIYMIKALS